MPIKTIILDRDGTLYNEYTGELQPGIPEMITRLKRMGLELFVASNEAREKKVEDLIGLPRDQFLYNTDCGIKGSKNYIRKVMEVTGHSLNELVYLGDSELDMREAAGGHERVALFNAEWSHPNYMYGFGETTPAEFADDIETYFLKDKLWYLKVDGNDALNRNVRFRSLLDPDTAKDQGITRLLKERAANFADNERDLQKAAHLVTHLIASVYLEGIHLERMPNKQNGFKKPLWCLYPGCKGGLSPILRLFERFTARLLTMSYYENLLIRHTPVESSKETRMRTGNAQDISVQLSSVMIDEAAKNKVKDNVVFVVDDFSTGSNAMETARNLFYAAGSAKVVGISVGKYGGGYLAYTPGANVKLPKPGEILTVNQGDMVRQAMATNFDANASAQF